MLYFLSLHCVSLLIPPLGAALTGARLHIPLTPRRPKANMKFGAVNLPPQVGRLKVRSRVELWVFARLSRLSEHYPET